MRSIISFFIFIIIISCKPSNPMNNLPPPKNCDCQKCYISLGPLTPFNPLYINPLIEIYDESGSIIGKRFGFYPWESSIIEIPCCKKVRIDICYWIVCSAYQPIYAKLVECRGFLSPINCVETTNDLIFQCVTSNCNPYPFQ